MEEAAQASVRNEVEIVVERVSGDVMIAGASTLEEAVETNQIRIGPSFAGMSADELELQTIPGGTVTVIFEIDESEGSGELTLLTQSVAEGGVGFGNAQAVAYACWSLPIDLAARTAGKPTGATCPEGAVKLMGGLEPFEL